MSFVSSPVEFYCKASYVAPLPPPPPPYQKYIGIITQAESYIRTVNPKQKIYVTDIVGLRDALYYLGLYLRDIGFDASSINVALKYLEDVKPMAFDIFDAKMRNAISYALYYIYKAILMKT
jgi:hypothetical protein